MGKREAVRIAPNDLVLDIAREHWLGVRDPEARFLESWSIQAHVVDDSGRRTALVGEAQILILRIGESFGEGINLIKDVLDAHTSDLLDIGTVLIDPLENDLKANLNLSTPGDLLILDRVRLDPLYRGQGLGPVIAGVAIKELSRGCSAAACIPAPTEGELEGKERTKAVMGLRRTWASLGFRHVDDNVWLLDLGMVTLRDALGELLSE